MAARKFVNALFAWMNLMLANRFDIYRACTRTMLVALMIGWCVVWRVPVAWNRSMRLCWPRTRQLNRRPRVVHRQQCSCVRSKSGLPTTLTVMIMTANGPTTTTTMMMIMLKMRCWGEKYNIFDCSTIINYIYILWHTIIYNFVCVCAVKWSVKRSVILCFCEYI